MERKDFPQHVASVPNDDVFLKARIRFLLNRLFNNYLNLLEGIVDDHDEAMTKLIDALPENEKKLVLLADYLPEYKVKGFKKRVLDSGNDVIRELEETIDSLQIRK